MLLPLFLGLIPGVPHPFVHAFLWWTPIPSRADLPTPAEGLERILIVAPHPDDEVLAVGGTIAHLVEEGHTVLVVFLTNGDANRAAKRLLTFNFFNRGTDYRALGYRRQKEAVRALERLGVSSSQLVFLGYPDRGLTALWSDHWKREKPYTSPYTKVSYPFYSNSYNPWSVYCGEDLLSDLVAIAQQFRPTMVYLPHHEDEHPDHQAGFLFAMTAFSALGTEARPDVRLYLVHAPGWPFPRQLVPSKVLEPPDSPEEWSWQSFKLSEEAVKKKLAAVRTYTSQRWTNGRFLAAFVRPNELYLACEDILSPR